MINLRHCDWQDNMCSKVRGFYLLHNKQVKKKSYRFANPPPTHDSISIVFKTESQVHAPESEQLSKAWLYASKVYMCWGYFTLKQTNYEGVLNKMSLNATKDNKYKQSLTLLSLHYINNNYSNNMNILLMIFFLFKKIYLCIEFI